MKQPTEAMVTYRLRSGETFVLSDGIFEARVLNEIWVDRAYEPTPEFVIKAGWNVIDAGAHKGIFAVRADHAGANVIAIEPEAANCAVLRQNLERNGCTHVSVLEAALWCEAGEAVLHSSGPDASTTASLVPGEDGDATEVVRTVTLQSLVEEAGGQVDLIKVDIEGAEIAVLGSTPPETLQRIDRIVLDCYTHDPEEGDEMVREIESLLGPLGFECQVKHKTSIFYARRK